MPKIAYIVIATLPTEAIATDYVHWLNDGHVQAVVAGGATVGEIIRLDPDPALRVMSRYEFSSRGMFDQYVRDIAPRLREEGLSRFGPVTGVTFQRFVGEVDPTP